MYTKHDRKTLNEWKHILLNKKNLLPTFYMEAKAINIITIQVMKCFMYMMVHIIKNVKKMMYYMILYPVLQKHIIIQFKIGNIKQKSQYYGKLRTMY